MSMIETTRREWLLTDQPASRRQARLGQIYRTWLTFRRNKLAMIGLGIVLLLVLIAVFADAIAPYDPIVGGDLRTARLLPPSWAHLMGTDDQARDIFSRVVHGSRLTLMVVALVAIIATPIGLLVGTTAGYFGGWVDTVLMRITDIFLAFPRLILALAFVAALGPGIENAIIAIAITSWPPYARLARAETLTIRDTDYIAAIRLQGRFRARIISGHVVPLCLSSVIIRVTLDMAGIILTAAGLGLSRPRCTAAAARMGRDDRRWPAVPDRLLVGCHDARHCDLHRLARLQPAGRRPARRARPEGGADERSSDGRQPAHRLPLAPGPGRGRARRLFRAGPRTAGHRRRKRLRQIADRPRDPRPDAAARHRHRRQARLRRHRPAQRDAIAMARHPRRTDQHGHAGPEILAEPGDDHRPPD